VIVAHHGGEGPLLAALAAAGGTGLVTGALALYRARLGALLSRRRRSR
jgi:hypothetical protein